MFIAFACSQVIFKSMRLADVRFWWSSKCEWVTVRTILGRYDYSERNYSISSVGMMTSTSRTVYTDVPFHFHCVVGYSIPYHFVLYSNIVFISPMFSHSI